jgi:hypothetical protein
MQLYKAIDECRREYEILIDAVIDSQRGVIQPQRITPTQILEQITTSQADMPRDLSLFKFLSGGGRCNMPFVMYCLWLIVTIFNVELFSV